MTFARIGINSSTGSRGSLMPADAEKIVSLDSRVHGEAQRAVVRVIQRDEAKTLQDGIS